MVEPLSVAERLAAGGRVQRLAGGEKMLGANDVFRLWREDGTVILKLYGTDARARREAHALADRDACGKKLLEQARPGDRIVVMGARDDTLSEFASELLDELGKVMAPGSWGQDHGAGHSRAIRSA